MPIPHSTAVAPENATHGSAAFPCVCYDSWINEWLPAFHLHWHPEVEFNLVLSGQAELILEFSTYTLSPGDILLVNKKSVHGFYRKDDQDFNVKAVLFQLDFLSGKGSDAVSQDYIAPLDNGEREFLSLIHPADPVYPRLRSMLEEVFSLYKSQRPHYSLLMKARLLEVVYLLYEADCVRSTGTLSPRNRSLKDAIDFIGQNYARPIPAQEAANVAGYSKYHFLRIFKTAVGMDFSRYVNQVRLDQAALLLKTTSLSVTEIALTVGFSDSAYFTKRFREAYHITPLAFRRGK